MTITIPKSQIEKVCASIKLYFLRSVWNDEIEEGMQVLCGYTDFYSSLSQSSQNLEDGQNVTIEVDEFTIKAIPEMIDAHINEEVREMDDNDMDWLCTMVSVYKQLVALRQDGTSANYSHRNNDTEFAPQEIKKKFNHNKGVKKDKEQPLKKNHAVSDNSDISNGNEQIDLSDIPIDEDDYEVAAF